MYTTMLNNTTQNSLYIVIRIFNERWVIDDSTTYHFDLHGTYLYCDFLIFVEVVIFNS